MAVTRVSPTAKIISARRLSRLTSPYASEVLATIDWDALAVTSSSVDRSLELFYEQYFAALDRIAPISRIKVNSTKLAPWLNPELREAQRSVRVLYRRFRRSRKQRDLIAYRRARDAFKLRLSESRISYYRTRLEGLSQAGMWRELRSLGLLKTRPFNQMAVDPETLNESLARFSISDLEPDNAADPDSAPAPLNRPLFGLTRVTADEVKKTFLSMKSNARGSDGLSLSMFLPVLSTLIYFIVGVFNKCIETCSFLAVWKGAVIVPIPVTANPSNAGDYRPVSLLPTLSKAFEQLIHHRIMEYITRYSPLDSFQCGFRAGHSTSMALLRLPNDVRHGMDRRKVTVLVLSDFSEAFDSVSHVLLLRKLRNIGFSRDAADWVRAYLSDRRQAIKREDGSLTNWIHTNTGVPQGSVLGPLLFSLFVNDIGSVIHFARRLLYADDLQIYASCSPEDLGTCIDQLNADIARIRDWALRNHLKLNLLKTKAIILGNNRLINAINTDELPPLTDGIDQVPLVSTVKNLGVMLDSKLTFHDHVSLVTSKVHGTLYKLQQLREYTDTALRKSLVCALLKPHLDYCSCVLSGAGVVNDLRLQRLANRGVRYVFNLPRDAAISPYRRQLGWISVRESREFAFACLAYNVFIGLAPPILAELLLVRQANSRTTRGGLRRSLVVPNHRTEAYRHSSAVAIPLIWNAIPNDITAEPSIASFKAKLRTWFLARAEAPQ